MIIVIKITKAVLGFVLALFESNFKTILVEEWILSERFKAAMN